MQITLFYMGLAFLEGFILIISPCILPILPIMLSASLAGSKKRPLGIITGFIILFALFTLFARKLVQISGIDLNIIRNITFGLLLLLGCIMLSNYLTEQSEKFLQYIANIISGTSLVNAKTKGFWGGFIFGGLVGLIWTPCAGPILAAVIVQTVLQKSTLNSFLTLLAFGLGAGIPMLFIAYLGRNIIDMFQVLRTHAILFRKIVGGIIILSVLYIVYGQMMTLPFAKVDEMKASTGNGLTKGVYIPYPAPPLEGISAWINSKPLQINQLKGKVILIDFWAYSCINCVHTIPYLNAWYQKYQNKGFIIIGVHCPEFDFEHQLDLVKAAVKNYQIKYPVALDNNFNTWQNYHNFSWPTHY